MRCPDLPSPRRPAALPLLLLACTLPARAAAAAGGDIADLDLTALGDLTVQAAALQEAPAGDAAAAVFVLTAEDLRVHGFRTLGEALASVPGLYAYRDDLFPMVGVRGVGGLADYGTRILFLLDGHRLNDGLGLGPTRVGPDLPVPLEAVKRVEVVKGPVGSVYGPTAFLAVVNLVTFEADDRATQLAAGVAAAQGRLREGSGSGVLTARLGELGLTLAAGGGGARGTSVSLPELQLPVPGRDPAAGPSQAGYGAHQALQGFARLEWRGLSAKAGCAAWDARQVAAGYYSLVGDDRARVGSTVCFADAGYGGRLAERLEGSLRLSWDEVVYRDAYPYPPPPDGWGLFRDRGTDRWGTLDGLVRWRPFEGTLAIGGATGTLHRTMQRAWTDGLPTIQQDPVNGAGAGAIPKDFSTLNGYLIVEQRLPVGVRLELALTWFWHELYGHRATPKAAAVWSPTAADTVKLIYAQGFRPPTAAEAFYEDGASYLANPALRPEVVDSGELVYERRLGPASISASLFANRYTHLIRFATVPAPGVASPDPANPADWRQQPVNAGAMNLRGAELAVHLRWGRWLTGHGGLSVQRIDEEGRVNSPDLAAALALATRALWEPLSLSVRASWLGRRPRDPANAGAGPATAPGAGHLDLHALLDVPGARGLSLEAGVANLTGAAAPSLLPADFAPVTELPDAPRTFRLGLRWKLD